MPEAKGKGKSGKKTKEMKTTVKRQSSPGENDSQDSIQISKAPEPVHTAKSVISMTD